eukprot:TRINITY_DN2402_c1_g1_i2.p1 TRINITY_DN2402_c1_g1~~TRINITY_DN2402_c1_g1_i2.p1  ORF type:complete len:408 (-),score=85.66 TRINITY_DN2402_c1_g1_i2:857-2080(-)
MAKHILFWGQKLTCAEVLRPFTQEHGGPLKLNRVTFVPGRGNLFIEYPAAASTDRVVTIAGSHLDVVPADPAQWTCDPFQLTCTAEASSGKHILRGRGVTDCLGHCALLCVLFVQLAKVKPALPFSMLAVLTSDEEIGNANAGIDPLMVNGHLDRLKNGPVFWLDCADMMPNIGCGGMATWELVATGKQFHSGMPNRGINALELAWEAVSFLQKRFYVQFPRLKEKEELYKFECQSSMKPTTCTVPGNNAINQIPDKCVVQGDLRMVPFYDVKEVVASINSWVKELNDTNFAALESRGPSKYSGGKVAIRWIADLVQGMVCDLDADSYTVLCAATELVLGRPAVPYSDTGALPALADLKKVGMDVQMMGYGVEEAYHANDEYGRLEDFHQGFDILRAVITMLAERKH